METIYLTHFAKSNTARRRKNRGFSNSSQKRMATPSRLELTVLALVVFLFFVPLFYFCFQNSWLA